MMMDTIIVFRAKEQLFIAQCFGKNSNKRMHQNLVA